MTTSATPSRRYSASAIGVLALAVAYFSGTAGAQTLDAKDCAALLSWAPYAAWTGLASCSPAPTCGTRLVGCQCSTSGRVTAMSLPYITLGGTLPKEWGAMTALTSLSLYRNNLSGTLPKEWGAMTALTSLDLGGNNLSGTLPKEWGAMTALTYLYLDRTSVDIDSVFFQTWMDTHFCTLRDYLLVLPNGDSAICSTRKRRLVVMAISGMFLSLLVVVAVLRCCKCWRADSMFSCCMRKSSSGWMERVQQWWHSSQGARQWLLPQWKLLSVFLDVGSDIWVLVQVAPKGQGSPQSHFVMFAVLLGGLFIPNLVACTVACWTWVSYSHPSTGVPKKLLLTIGWLLPFAAWLHFHIIKHISISIVGVCFSKQVAQPHENTASSLSHVVDPVKYSAFLSAVMAVTEDPISASVTSVFYLVNKQYLGQVLSAQAYALSMVLSCVHMLMEGWEHFPHIREQGMRRCLAGVCSMQADGKGEEDEGPIVLAGAVEI